MDTINNLEANTFQIGKILEGAIQTYPGGEETSFNFWLAKYADILERFDVSVESDKGFVS